MSVPHVLELDALLEPISAEQPAGVDPRVDAAASATWFVLKDARTAARAAERRGDFDEVIGGTEAAEWRVFTTEGPRLLRERSKDLELAAWMTEALARTHGFAGLATGFRLARELVERFWDELWPRPDEDGIATRVAPIAGLNGEGGPGTLVAPIARIALFGMGEEAVASFQCRRALELERTGGGGSGPSQEQVRAAAATTATAQLVTRVAEIEAALAEWRALGEALDARCGADSPPASNVRAALEEALEMLRHVAGERLPRPVEEAPPEEPGSPANAAAEAGAAGAARGAIGTREGAIHTLEKVATFFRTTEPHSPLSYLLERAVRWGRTPLPELLGELIPDDGARVEYERLIGIERREAND